MPRGKNLSRFTRAIIFDTSLISTRDSRRTELNRRSSSRLNCSVHNHNAVDCEILCRCIRNLRWSVVNLFEKKAACGEQIVLSRISWQELILLWIASQIIWYSRLFARTFAMKSLRIKHHQCMHADPLMRTYAYLCSRLNHPNYYNGLGIRVRQHGRSLNSSLSHGGKSYQHIEIQISKSAMIDVRLSWTPLTHCQAVH